MGCAEPAHAADRPEGRKVPIGTELCSSAVRTKTCAAAGVIRLQPMCPTPGRTFLHRCSIIGVPFPWESPLPIATVARPAYLLTVLAAVACAGQAPGPETLDHAALRAGVDSAANRLLTALRSDASDSLMALMADDVVLMPPNEPVLRGKTAVRAWYDQLLTQLRTSSLTITDREVLIGGEWATELAAFEWTLVPVAGGPAVIDRGSYVQVWHREPDGRWLFSRELWNSTAPLMAPSKGP